jgi:uncharacterized membrane-anchored protein
MCSVVQRKGWALIVGVLILLGVNAVIYSRERLLREGQAVFLELAPVDPRSLMQGDYMALDFQAAQAVKSQSARTERHGVAVLRLNERGIGQVVRLGTCAPLQAGERCIRYQRRGRWNNIQFSTNAFFFQEGTGKRYEQARYGEFRVAENGVALLKSLRGADLQVLEDKPAQAPAAR